MQKSEVTDSKDVPRGTILDTGLIPVEEAAAALGITEKRLVSLMARQSLADPIGDGRMVYGWSCRTLAERIADTSAAARAADEATAAPLK